MVASILLYVSLAVSTSGRLRMLVVGIGLPVLFCYLYWVAGFGVDMTNALLSVAVLIQASPVKAVLVVPAYYPVVAGLVVVVLVLAAFSGLGSRVRPLVSPVGGLVFAMASLVLLSLWPVV